MGAAYGGIHGEEIPGSFLDFPSDHEEFWGIRRWSGVKSSDAPHPRFGDRMEPDDLLCSRNARPQKDGKDSLAVLLLAERAQSECARSTRAFEDRPAPL